MRECREERIKKLALAFKTGWEYRPGEEEAGSVIADCFLDMMDENWKRYSRLWEKQELEFQQSVPPVKEEGRRQKGAVCITVPAERNGKELAAGAKVSTISSQEQYLQFETTKALFLSSARLQYVIFEQKGVFWLLYDAAREGPMPEIPLFQAGGEKLQHPVFTWHYRNLCNGLKKCRWKLEFAQNKESSVHELLAAGSAPEVLFWAVSDGRTSYPLELVQTEEGLVLSGETKEYAGNLTDTEYEIRLELCAAEHIEGEEVPGQLQALLSGGFTLREIQNCWQADICIGESGATQEESVRPFGDVMEEQACLYIACDKALARENGELYVTFEESFLKEKCLPALKSRRYKKIIKKYPWLNSQETVYDWKASETVWEYWNGRVWCRIPENGSWDSSCQKEDSLRTFHFQRPEDMQACVVDGEEHFFLRARIERIENAYALYYEKWIPVWENIRIKTTPVPLGRREMRLQSLLGAGKEQMLFGFDTAVAETASFFTAVRNEETKKVQRQSWSPARSQLTGYADYGGREGFWVTAERQADTPLLTLLGLWNNYVEIVQSTTEAAERISAGSTFTVELLQEDTLQAVSPYDAFYDRVGAPFLDTRENAEHFFSHGRRILTAEDIRLLCKERYPFLSEFHCHMEDGTLVLTLGGEHGMPAENEIAEIREWLDGEICVKGNIWLQGCQVEVRQTENGGEGHAGKDRTG